MSEEKYNAAQERKLLKDFDRTCALMHESLRAKYGASEAEKMAGRAAKSNFAMNSVALHNAMSEFHSLRPFLVQNDNNAVKLLGTYFPSS